jgi:hypothetical protein
LATALLLAVLVTPAVRAQERGGGSHDPAPSAPVFVDFSPIILPVIGQNRVTERVGIVLALELAQGKVPASVEAKRRILTDAFISDLYGIFQQRAALHQVADGKLIKARLLQTANRVLGPGVVKDVLIQKLFEQPR